MSTVSKLIPMFDRVLVKKAAKISQVGGIIIPESAQVKVNEGIVIAAGTKSKDLAKGDKVLLPEFGGFKVDLDPNDKNSEFFIFEEKLILGKFTE